LVTGSAPGRSVEPDEEVSLDTPEDQIPIDRSPHPSRPPTLIRRHSRTEREPWLFPSVPSDTITGMTRIEPSLATDTPADSAIELVDLHPPRPELRRDVVEGLRQQPKRLEAKLFYDERGSRLFERITELEEYYLTRAETAIYRRHAARMLDSFGARLTLIELGSGSSSKVRILLDASDAIRTYMPIDISVEFLRRAAERIAADYRRLRVVAVCADYTRIDSLPVEDSSQKRVVFFPGSTIGNLEPEDVVDFLGRFSRLLQPGDGFLIGADSRKDPAVLHAAYNDREGVTADFNLNILERINRELGADFALDAFEHVAFYSETEGRIEMHLRSLARQSVSLAGERFELAPGEMIHTENSYKYAAGQLEELAGRAGLAPVEVWSDPDESFRVHGFRLAPH
jgi:dimethylhistidine N-methyltransferase